MSDLDEIIKSSPVIVHKGRYAYLKAQETTLNNHFLISQDEDEITVIREDGLEKAVEALEEIGFEIRK